MKHIGVYSTCLHLIRVIMTTVEDELTLVPAGERELEVTAQATSALFCTSLIYYAITYHQAGDL